MRCFLFIQRMLSQDWTHVSRSCSGLASHPRRAGHWMGGRCGGSCPCRLSGPNRSLPNAIDGHRSQATALACNQRTKSGTSPRSLRATIASFALSSRESSARRAGSSSRPQRRHRVSPHPSPSWCSARNCCGRFAPSDALRQERGFQVAVVVPADGRAVAGHHCSGSSGTVVCADLGPRQSPM